MSISTTSTTFPPVAFASESFQTSPQQNKKDLLTVNKLVNYLKDVCGIQIPEDFVVQLSEAHFSTSNCSYVGLYRTTVDSVISACTKWKQYLRNQAEFDRLVCNRLVSMTRCHATVLSVYSIRNAGFELLKEKPSSSYATIVCQNGEVKEMR